MAEPRAKPLLVERYRPQTLSALRGHEAKKKELCRWIASRKREPYLNHQIAVLSGPPGIGKTLLAHLALQEYGYKVVELNGSDCRTPVSSAAGKKKKSHGDDADSGVDVDTIYAYGKSLFDVSGERLALVLDDVHTWTNLDVKKLCSLLVLHKEAAKKALDRTRKCSAEEKKLTVALGLEDERDHAHLPPARRPLKAVPSTAVFGLPKTYPRPLVCPIIVTVSSPPFSDRIKTLLASCLHISLDRLPTPCMRAILDHVRANERLLDLSRTDPDSLLQLANGDARKLLNTLNLLLSPSSAAPVLLTPTGDACPVKSLSHYDGSSAPDLFRTAREFFVRRAECSLEETLAMATQADLLPEFAFHNYPDALRDSELPTASAISELCAEADALCFHAPVEYRHVLACFGVSRRLSNARTHVAFPSPLLCYSSKASARQAQRRKLTAGTRGGYFFRLSLLEQQESGHLLIRKTGNEWLSAVKKAAKNAASKPSRKKTTQSADGYLLRQPPLPPKKPPKSLASYGFYTVAQVELLKKLAALGTCSGSAADKSLEHSNGSD